MNADERAQKRSGGLDVLTHQPPVQQVLQSLMLDAAGQGIFLSRDPGTGAGERKIRWIMEPASGPQAGLFRLSD